MNSGDRENPLRASGYLPLVAFLSAHKDDEVTLTFAEIEQLLGKPLSQPAFTQAWWTRGRTGSYPRPWASIGWVVKSAEPRLRRVTFARRQAVPPSLPA
jgi:hypothetical protein